MLLLSPLFLIIWISVYLTMGSPVIFRQQRPGLHGGPFTLVKFRTMRISGSDSIPDSVRLTSFGRFLRRTSMDELPELLNVLRGEMSLVGPRPLLMEYLPLYKAEQRRRHNLKPGLTGWAQINGRNAISWEQKFELDLWYIDHWSLWLDVKIVWMTVGRVLRGSGVSDTDHATTRKFTGSVI